MSVRATGKAVTMFVVVNIRELIFGAGLVATTTGVALLSVPAAMVVMGAILMWLALPPQGDKQR